MRFYLLITVLLIQIGCLSYAQKTQNSQNRMRSERKPFQRNTLDLKSPVEYEKRETGNGKEYDPKPAVKLIDERAGNYEFSWIGYDKKKKIVIYQREDAIDALVEAKIEKDSGGGLTYKYLIKNLPDSPTYVRTFVIQTRSPDVKLVRMDDVYAGDMSNNVKGNMDGFWKGFAILGQTSPTVDAGKSIEFALTSLAPPGLVECKLGGGQGETVGVGEHMPEELDRIVPVNLWAKSYTIGPIDSLSKLSKPERAKYFLDNIPKFVEAGWMSGDTAKIYQTILERNDLVGALEQAKKDAADAFITSDVLYIIQGLNQ